MRQPCTIHKGPCEGNALHIMGRCKNGCAQFQDGSWFTKTVCFEEHPGLPIGTGKAAETRDWLEAEFARNRR